jgi:hypothetical protein
MVVLRSNRAVEAGKITLRRSSPHDAREPWRIEHAPAGSP